MTTIDKTEVEKFSRIASDWWNPNGKFKPLHVFNPARIKLIKDKIISYYSLDPKSKKPLSKINILDIGCGGGLLCEPLKRLGAEITGIDASINNIKAAKLHAEEMDLNINYINCSPENLKTDKKFKVILNMEIVEHVSDVNLFVQKCSSLIEKNGIMFVATINKNLKSYLFAIVGAEYILRWLPIGTHDWNKFIKPEELEKKLKNINFSTKDISGLTFNPITSSWKRDKNLSVNYIISTLKN